MVSSEWYTPDDIWARVYKTLSSDFPYDPCPILGSNGLNKTWQNLTYLNPPSPAAVWAREAIKRHLELGITVLYASFSEAVIWQVPELKRYPTCWVRKRIRWVDSKTGSQSTKPRNYNAFHLLSHDRQTIDRFRLAFEGLGPIEISTII